MKLKIDEFSLEETLKYFHMLTGIRTVIFDTQYKEIFAYPKDPCKFCKTIGKNEELAKKCHLSDINAFEKCKFDEGLYVYKCHAGLVEASMPIRNGKKVIGYIMLGQITDIKDKKELKDLEKNIFEKHGVKCDTSGIKYKTKNQILAASKLLEICTDYMILKEMIGAENEKIIISSNEYIKNHLSESINIYDLCNYVGVARTKLYETFNKEYGVGIATYIRDTRLNEAKRLIKTTDFSIAEISEKTGFSDYNYFSRLYKKKFNITPYKDKER